MNHIVDSFHCDAIASRVHGIDHYDMHKIDHFVFPLGMNQTIFDFLNTISNTCINGDNIYGKGTYGQVYNGTHESRPCIAKLQSKKLSYISDESDFAYDSICEMHKIVDLQDHNLSPQLYHFCFCYNEDTIYSVIIMERLIMIKNVIIALYMQNRRLLVDICKKISYADMCLIEKHSIVHRDYKISNICCRIKNTDGTSINADEFCMVDFSTINDTYIDIIPIDFGMSIYTYEEETPSAPQSLDIIRLLHSIILSELPLEMITFILNCFEFEKISTCFGIKTRIDTQDDIDSIGTAYCKQYMLLLGW